MKEVINHGIMITGFVFVMMLAIEYLNVLTSGAWKQHLNHHRWIQYLAAVILGTLPGCLGPYAVVAMYSHGVMTVGAVVATMIATSGDESFVMLAMIPKQTFVLMICLSLLGLITGMIVDAVVGRRKEFAFLQCHGFQIHEEEMPHLFSRSHFMSCWKDCSLSRGVLTLGLLLFIGAILLGGAGPETWNWIKLTLVLVSLFSLFIVITVPDHFLEEHLWNHIFKEHMPRIFLWTISVLIIVHFMVHHLQVESFLMENNWLVLGIASIVGLIPESGPHLIFVTLFAKGAIPFSVLLASSVVQDGHGMLPLLAHSRKGFVFIKLINLVIGLMAGSLLLIIGY